MVNDNSFWTGDDDGMAQKYTDTNPTKNGLHARAMFMSIMETTGFSNRRHQQGLVRERKQQEFCVPNEAYTMRAGAAEKLIAAQL